MLPKKVLESMGTIANSYNLRGHISLYKHIDTAISRVWLYGMVHNDQQLIVITYGGIYHYINTLIQFDTAIIRVWLYGMVHNDQQFWAIDQSL